MIVDINSTSGKKFKPGDFITFSNKEGSFAIYEGVDISTSSLKKLTSILSYDPSKYVKTEEGYKTCPFLEISSKTKNCEKTIDTDESSYWVRKCNAEEIERAIKIMKDYGYIWDEENLSVLYASSGSVATKIRIPKIEYNGQIIKATPDKLKALLKVFCKEKSKKQNYSYGGTAFWDMYGYDNYWDYD